MQPVAMETKLDLPACCGIQHLHFNCKQRHFVGVERVYVSTLRAPPSNRTLIEEVLWNFHPPWHDALNDESKQAAFGNLGDGDSLLVFERKLRSTQEATRVICLVSADRSLAGLKFATSDLMFGTSSYQASLGKRHLYSDLCVKVPAHLQKPFSQDELAWISQQSDAPLHGPNPPFAPIALATTLASVKPALVEITRRKGTGSFARFSQNELFDINVCRLMLSYAIPPSKRHSRLVADAEQWRMNGKAGYDSISPDRRLLCNVHHRVKYGETHVVVEWVNSTLALRFNYRQPPIDEPLCISINSDYLAILFGFARVIICSHDGQLIAYFDLPPSSRTGRQVGVHHSLQTNTQIELHPTLPYLALSNCLYAEVFDFQGRFCWVAEHISGMSAADELCFDVSNELLLCQRGHEVKAFPLNGSPPYYVKLDFSEITDISKPIAVHFHNNQEHLIPYRWVTPQGQKRKIHQ